MRNFLVVLVIGLLPLVSSAQEYPDWNEGLAPICINSESPRETLLRFVSEYFRFNRQVAEAYSEEIEMMADLVKAVGVSEPKLGFRQRIRALKSIPLPPHVFMTKMGPYCGYLHGFRKLPNQYFWKVEKINHVLPNGRVVFQGFHDPSCSWGFEKMTEKIMASEKPPGPFQLFKWAMEINGNRPGRALSFISEYLTEQTFLDGPREENKVLQKLQPPVGDVRRDYYGQFYHWYGYFTLHFIFGEFSLARNISMFAGRSYEVFERDWEDLRVDELARISGKYFFHLAKGSNKMLCSE